MSGSHNQFGRCGKEKPLSFRNLTFSAGSSSNANSQSEPEALERFSVPSVFRFSLIYSFLWWEPSDSLCMRGLNTSTVGYNFLVASILSAPPVGKTWERNEAKIASLAPQSPQCLQIKQHTNTHTHTQKKVNSITYWILNYRQFPIFDKVISLFCSDKILSAICMGFT